MIRISFDKQGKVKKTEIIVVPKLRPAKQKHNQKKAKVWATRFPASMTKKEKKHLRELRGL